MQAVGKDQATESGDLKTIAGPLLLHVRQAKQQQRRGLAGAIFPVPFDGRDLRRLMLKGVKTMHIPTTAWIGATSSAIHIAIDSILRMAGESLPRRRCHAADAPTNMALLRNAAIAIWNKRDTEKRG